MPIVRFTTGTVAPRPGCRPPRWGRQDARADGHHLGGAAARDVGHQGAGERGLRGHQDVVARGQCDGIAHQSRVRGGRGAAGHLAAEGGAGGEHGPRRRLPHGGRERIGHVLGDRGTVQHDHEVGSRRRQRCGVKGAPRGSVRRRRAERVDGGVHLRSEARRRAEEFLGHTLTAGLGEDGDDPGGTPVPALVLIARRSRRAGPRRQGAASAELVHGFGDLRVDRTVEDALGACVLHGSRRPDRRRAARLPPGPGAEPGRVHPGEPLRSHGGPAGRVDLAGVAEALGDREHRGQRQFHLL